MPIPGARRALFVLANMALSACRGRQAARLPAETAAMDSSDQPVAEAAHAAMSGPMATDPHLLLTPVRPGSPADTARAIELVGRMRAALDRYRDVRTAEADGFRKFLPGVNQPVYHFTNWRWALEAAWRFDVTRPTSLLYRAGPGGTLALAGAMYTAPARASLEELDRRIPLSVARWHEHVNWCLPPRGRPERWRETRDGTPVFGPRSPVATAETCAAVGGRFVPRLFGWMVHVMAFEGDDPRVIWGGEGGHQHS